MEEDYIIVITTVITGQCFSKIIVKTPINIYVFLSMNISSCFLIKAWFNMFLFYSLKILYILIIFHLCSHWLLTMYFFQFISKCNNNSTFSWLTLIKLNPYLTPYIKIRAKQIKYVNTKSIRANHIRTHKDKSLRPLTR